MYTSNSPLTNKKQLGILYKRSVQVFKNTSQVRSDLSPSDFSANFVNAIEDLRENFVNIGQNNLRNFSNRTQDIKRCL